MKSDSAEMYNHVSLNREEMASNVTVLTLSELVHLLLSSWELRETPPQ